MFATLDKDAYQGQGNQEERVITQNDIIQAINSDPFVQNDMSTLNQSQMVNFHLANEVLSLLREIENPLYDSADGIKYINWETETIPYQVLRKAGESEPARLIINKRRLGLVQYGKSPLREGDRGAELVFCNPDYQPTKQEKLLLREWEQKLFDKIFFPANDPYPNFGKFLGSNYEDQFILDDMTWEYRMDGFNRTVAIHQADPIVYKPVIKERTFQYNELYKDDITQLLNDYQKLFREEEIKSFERADDPDYLLVYQNHKLAGVTRERVRKFHFNVRSDFKKAQRGYSVVEQGIRLITSIYNALTMNASNFNNNRLPPGFFLFTGGGINSMQLEKLKKIFYAYQQGPGNSNRFPMLSITGEKADGKWVGARASSREAEYHQFMTLLFSIFCQYSGTDPRECSIGSYADAVGKKSLFEESSDGLIKESKDQGEKVFLHNIADCINTPNKYGVNIWQGITKLDVKLRFTGFEIEDKKMKAELTSKELQSTKSINDLLASEDEEKQTLMLGDKNIYDIKGIQNPQIFQAVMFGAQQQAQQQAMIAQNGIQGQPGQQAAGQQQEQPQPGQQQEEQQNLNNNQNYSEEDEDLKNRYKQKAEKYRSALNAELQNELEEQG